MPPVRIDPTELAKFGAKWTENGGSLSRSPPFSSMNLCEFFDKAVAVALAEMLGGLEIVRPKASHLSPAKPDVVEQGPVRVIGGVRPQNFDVGYRPDGLRFAFDSKSLNDKESVGKNWQNMVNDISTEATTVHSRFPHAVVGFMILFPSPTVEEGQLKATIETLERLGRRVNVHNFAYMAEAISLVIWDPANGQISPQIPAPDSPLRIERFHEQVFSAYSARYKGLPPHAAE